MSSFKKPSNSRLPQLTKLTRDQHPISRKNISDNALKVLYRLHNSGFEAYLVGGCVRDLLLGIQPKDFDVTTNATPEQVKKLFRNCRLIGRRFRLAHIVFGRDIIEVATFRGHHKEDHDEATSHERKQPIAKTDEQGFLVRDNVYGSIEEDAERRDFTVNAMYYNIADFCIYDFAGGKKDLDAGVLRLIGDPEQRYREDPVRMLRAIRFATKLNMQMDKQVQDPIIEMASLLRNIPPARLFDEFLKMFMSGKASANFDMMVQHNLFQQMFPVLKTYIKDEQSPAVALIQRALSDTDKRVNNEQRVTPAYLLAVMLWYPMEARRSQLEVESGLPPMDALNIASADVIDRQCQTVALPKRFSLPVRDIWQLQLRLQSTRGGKAMKVLEHKKFRAAYDFLMLRAEIEGSDALIELSQFWTKAQKAPNKVIGKKPGRSGPKRRRRPRSRKKPTGSESNE
ncbi:polynucleotide adenylyltransferase PcnB [Idiomarina sp. MD25a]|uniref:polynucleotide adenylyltransferase PcnB n=1 Tax=Idiomarina sp. MD25a TaxID=1889913 RepID=UPI000B0C0DED|nr:polynucleotide adenylyltransferase PcnB [Idiomarina sp. MD25a]